MFTYCGSCLERSTQSFLILIWIAGTPLERELTFYYYWSIFYRISQFLPYMILTPNLEFLGLSWCANKNMPQLRASSTWLHHQQFTLIWPKLWLFLFFLSLETYWLCLGQWHQARNMFHPQIGPFLNPHVGLVHNFDGFHLLNLASFHSSLHTLAAASIAPLSSSALSWPLLPAIRAIHLSPFPTFLLELSSDWHNQPSACPTGSGYRKKYQWATGLSALTTVPASISPSFFNMQLSSTPPVSPDRTGPLFFVSPPYLGSCNYLLTFCVP